MRTSRKVSDMLALGFLLLAAALAGMAGAGEERRLELVVEDENGGEPLRLRLDTAELGYDPFRLLEGENRALTLEDGRTALMTRTATGLTVSVDGQEIEIPSPPDAACKAAEECAEITIEEHVVEGSAGTERQVIVREAIRVQAGAAETP